MAESLNVLTEGLNRRRFRILAERIRTSIEALSINLKQTNITTTVSLDIAQSHSKQTLDELIHEADKHLYRAKEKGRNPIHTSTSQRHPIMQ